MYNLRLEILILFEYCHRTLANILMQHYSISDRPNKVLPNPYETNLVGAVSRKLVLLDRRKQKIQQYFPCESHRSTYRSPINSLTNTWKENCAPQLTTKERLNFIQINRVQIKKTFERLWPILKFILERYNQQKSKDKEKVKENSTPMFPNFLKRKQPSPFQQVCKLTFFRSCCNKYSQYNRIIEQFFKTNRKNQYTKKEIAQLRKRVKQKCEQTKKKQENLKNRESIEQQSEYNDQTLHNLFGCCKQKYTELAQKSKLCDSGSPQMLKVKANVKNKLYMTQFEEKKYCTKNNASPAKSLNQPPYIKQLIPKLKQDLYLLKQSQLFKKIQNCDNASVYSLIAQGLELLDEKINLLNAITSICTQNQLQSCIRLREKFAKKIKLKSQFCSSPRNQKPFDKNKEECSDEDGQIQLKRFGSKTKFSKTFRYQQTNNTAQAQRSKKISFRTSQNSITNKHNEKTSGESFSKANFHKTLKLTNDRELKMFQEKKQKISPREIRNSFARQSIKILSKQQQNKQKRENFKNQFEKSDQENNSISSSSSSSSEIDLNAPEKEAEKMARQIFQIKRRRARRAKIKRIGLLDIQEVKLPADALQKNKKQRSHSIKQNIHEQLIDPSQLKLKRLSLRKSMMSSNTFPKRFSSVSSKFTSKTQVPAKSKVIEVTHKWQGNDVVNQQTSVRQETIKTQFPTERDLVKELLMTFSAQESCIMENKFPRVAAKKATVKMESPIEYEEFKDEPLRIDVHQNFMYNRDRVLQECQRIQSFLRKIKSQQSFDQLIAKAENNELKITGKLPEQQKNTEQSELKWIHTEQMKKTYAQLQQGIQQFKRDYQKHSSKRGYHMADFFLNMFHFCILRVEDEFPEFLQYAELKKKFKNSIREAAFLPTFDEIQNTIRLAHRDFEKKLIDFCFTFQKIQQEQVIIQKDLPTKVIFGSCRHSIKAIK